MKKLFWLALLISLFSSSQTRIDLTTQAQFSVPNDGSIGTVVNQLAKVNTSGNAINAGTTDTAIPVYVVLGGAGTSGNAQLAVGGPVTCKFDAGGGSAGDWVVASSTTAGRCHDASSTLPTTNWTFGFLLTSPSANSNGTVMLLSGFMQGAGGGGSFTGGTLTSELILAASATGAASLNIPSGTAPTTPQAGDAWRDGNGFNFIESTTTNGSIDVRSDQAGSTGPANTVRYTADSNVAKVSENGAALQEILQLTKTQTPQNKTLDATDVVPRASLAADALGWEKVCDTTTGSAVASITCTPTGAHVHNFYQFDFYTPGYTGNGIATIQGGNTSTADTGTNYSYAMLETATNSTSTANTGCRVGGVAVTTSRHVIGWFNNYANSKAKSVDLIANNLSESAGTAPTRDIVSCIWANTAGGIGTIQVIAYNATTGTTTTTFLTGARLIVLGRD